MDNEKKELNPNEMEQVDGGMSGVRGIRSNSREDIDKRNAEWEKETVVPFFKDTGNAIKNIGKAAYNWFTGLFSGDD